MFSRMTILKQSFIYAHASCSICQEVVHQNHSLLFRSFSTSYKLILTLHLYTSKFFSLSCDHLTIFLHRMLSRVVEYGDRIRAVYDTNTALIRPYTGKYGPQRYRISSYSRPVIYDRIFTVLYTACLRLKLDRRIYQYIHRIYTVFLSYIHRIFTVYTIYTTIKILYSYPI